MARDFTKNTSNHMSLGSGQLGSLVNGASSISIHCWANVDTIDSGVNNNCIFNGIINGSSAGFTFRIDGSAGTKVLRVGGRSVSSDSFQARNATSSFSTGVWHSCGGVLNIGGDAITPYFNGASEGGGAATFGNTTYTHGSPTANDQIGGTYATGSTPTSSSDQTDGRIAELAIWTVDIGAAGFASLNKGLRPSQIRPDALVFYAPLVGTASPERDIVSGLSGTITGTVSAASHPRVIGPNRRRVYVPATVAPPSSSVPVFVHHYRMQGIA